MGKLRLLLGLVEDKLREAVEQPASSVGLVILPRVALPVPGFPFDRLLHEYEEGDDEEGAKMAAAPVVQSLRLPSRSPWARTLIAPSWRIWG